MFLFIWKLMESSSGYDWNFTHILFHCLCFSIRLLILTFTNCDGSLLHHFYTTFQFERFFLFDCCLQKWFMFHYIWFFDLSLIFLFVFDSSICLWFFIHYFVLSSARVRASWVFLLSLSFSLDRLYFVFLFIFKI